VIIKPSFPLFLVIFCSAVGFASAQTNTVWSWCLSNSLQPVYVSRPFDSGMKRGPSFNGTSLGRQFAEYLRGRFDIKTTASCSTAGATDQASVAQRVQNYEADLRRQNMQVVELTDWNYIRDQVAIDASFDPKGDPTYINVEGTLPQDRFYCVSDTFQNTVYYAEPMRTTSPDTSTPSVAFFNMLQQKYGYKGQQTCLLSSEPRATLQLKARLDGARAAGKKVVSTGWPAAGSTTAQIRPQDNDNEPVRKSTVNQPAPSAQVRDIVTKEVSPAIAFCQATRALLVAYDCACLQVKIYQYRIAHPDDTLKDTPALARFFDGKLVDCEKCMTEARAKMEARNRAVSAGLKLPAQEDCVAEKVVSLLHANPVPSLAQSQLESAIKACR
jgi:hypothetical protein